MIRLSAARPHTHATPFGCLLAAVLYTSAFLLTLGLLVAAWPLVIAAAWGFTLAWIRGWPPRRLLVAAAWSLPMPLVLALAYGITAGTWQAAALAPADAYLLAWQQLSARNWLTATVIIAPVAIPAGLALAALGWYSRSTSMDIGTAGWTPSAPAAFDNRQWRRQTRTARDRVRAPGGVPLLSARGNPQLGATIRAVGHRSRPILELPYAALRSHLLTVGTTGAGKTTALIRLWAGFWAAATRRHHTGREHRPWLVVIDAKGGFDSRDTADLTLAALRDLGAEHVAVWPDDTALNLWALPPDRLSDILTDLIPTADHGPAAYYADVLAAAVRLAIHAPPGPPTSSSDFLTRLHRDWLHTAYATDPTQLHAVTAAAGHLGDIALRYRTLFNNLGTAFDGGRAVTDFDVLYCVVEGTASTTLAEAQARALVELVSDAAARWRTPDQPRRAGLLALDEFSAVAGNIPLYELTERCRSLGLAVHIAAQSWQGIAATDDERARLAATASAGTLVMRTPGPEELVQLAGTRRTVEIGRKLLGNPRRYGDEGTGRLQHAWTVDPDRVRDFTPGQAAYIHGNAATYLHIAPYRPSPLALPAPTPPRADADEPTPAPPRYHEDPQPPTPAPTPPPDLDDVFKDHP